MKRDLYVYESLSYLYITMETAIVGVAFNYCWHRLQ